MAFWDKLKWRGLTPEKLTERLEEVVTREISLREKELGLEHRERVISTTRTVEDEEKKLFDGLRDSRHNVEIEKLKLAHDVNKDKTLAESKKKIDELEAEKELTEVVHEHEKEHLQSVAKANEELSSIKNAKEVALVDKKSVDTQIDERKKTLGYVQENIDSLLAKKDGIIEGQKIAMEVYKSQLEYMQNVLAVAVGKIPTVNLNDFKINVEMPPTTTKGGGDKGQGGDKKQN